MGEHSTWWSFLPGLSTLEEKLSAWWSHTSFDHTMMSLGFSDGQVGLAHVMTSLLVFVLVVGGALILKSKTQDMASSIVPEPRFTIRNFLELFVESTYGIMKDIMGEKAAKYFLPLIGTAALFIFFSNCFGLIPGFAPPTSNFNTTVACALVIFFTTHIYGIREHGVAKYFKHFLGPVTKGPWWVWPGILALMGLMLVVEIISHLARPLSLSVRLAANLTADHTVVGGFYKLFALAAPIPIMMLGVIVCIVQTLVFCILSTVYISMAIAHEEH
jgi:F-type H+-transporting ATPase subunit a